MKQVSLLRDHPDVPGEGFLGYVSQVAPIDQDAPFRRVVQPREQVGNGRLASPGVPDECNQLMAHYELLALPVVDQQHRLLGVITVDDLLEEE